MNPFDFDMIDDPQDDFYDWTEIQAC